ncbi:MAG: tetratricopeptide repeat protein, partial [Bacteroidales bacterium]|nr:tetratricopeptide repeat protein [Bacteroidales bacterium]
MHSIKKIYIIILLTGISLALSDCSVEKNTGASRFYHSLTSRYNIYFNGYESFKAGLAKINTSYSDDFSELLRVFEYSDPSTASMCSSDMEKAIQKASKVISLKSISARPEPGKKREISETDRRFLEQKEYNKWVDDSYLLIGKARFYRHEFDEAESVFNHCISEANDENIKTEAMIWLARIANENGNYRESERILKEIEERPAMNRSLKAMFHTTKTDLYLKQEKYNEAAGSLSEALKFISGKRTRYRLTYLLAQLYERDGNSAMATSLYRKVIKMNPPYEVEFNAMINIAGIFDINSGNPEEIRKDLEKMLRDSKNADF